jgi:hypothetical protein
LSQSSPKRLCSFALRIFARQRREVPVVVDRNREGDEAPDVVVVLAGGEDEATEVRRTILNS